MGKKGLHFFRWLIILGMFLSLIGCGGSGGGSANPPMPTPTPTPTPAPASPLDNWHLRLDGVPTGFVDAAYGNAIFVGVGPQGSILTSPDTRKWTIRDSGSTFNLNAVTFSNGTFVAVGDSGTVLTSADGVTWVTRASGMTDNILKITFGNNKFVALGFGGAIITSSDGITWSVSTILHQPVKDIAFGNGIFAVVGDNGAIFTSSDALAWTSRNAGTSDFLNAITFGKGMFVAVGGLEGTETIVVRSADGIAWTALKVNNVPYNTAFGSIEYGNGAFVATGVRTYVIANSTDGVNWVMTDTQNLGTHGLAFGNGIFVAISQSIGGPSGPHPIFVSTSIDGVLWISRHLFTVGLGVPLEKGITFGNGLFVSVGSGMLVSPDGIVWTAVATDDYPFLYQVAYGNGIFVSVGESGTIVTSSNGEDWVTRSSGTTNSLNGIFFSGTLFVAVGDRGTILTSSDGTTWTERMSGTSNSLSAVTYGNGNFVAVGELGEVLTSQDGMHWQRINSGVLDDLVAVAYGNGRFLAVGVLNVPVFESITLVSGDTISWTKTVQTFSLSAVSYGGGFFVAAGQGVSTSSDGIIWNERQLPSGVLPQLTCATFGNGTFVIGGNVIYQSDPL